MIQKDKITSINQLYGVLMFDGNKWHTVTDKMTFPRADLSMNMFLDSRGIIYVGGVRADYTGSNTPYSFIFESTDGLNFTPVQQFIDATGVGKIWNFTEDKYGNVWAGEYTTHSKTTGGHLWRRRPNGIWTNVANWAPPEDHIHQVYYCPFRDALYVAIGDRDHGILKLPSDKINADGISASDFNFILPIDPNGKGVEVTAITSDSLYIYVGMDMHAPNTNARSIARITDSGISQSMEYVYPLAGCGVWGWADVDDAGNIIFSVRAINEWSCTDNYVNQILVSNDHGTTWTIVKDFGSSPTSSGMDHAGLASYYATNWSGLYGSGNGWGGKSLRGTIGRVLPANTTFYVDGNNGIDWTNFGTDQTRPIKTLNYLELLDIHPGDTVVFTGASTYGSPLIAGWSGNEANNIYLRGNTTSIFSGGNVAHIPTVAETFESAKASWNFTLNEAGGPITADTSIFHEGVQSAKIVRGSSGTTSLSLKNVATANVAENDKFYISYWLYYPSDITSSNDTTMLRMYDNANYEMLLQIRPSSVTHLINELTFVTSSNSATIVPSRKSLTSGTWHKIDIEASMHTTSGYFKMYVDDELWFFINGIKTITSGAKLNNVQFFFKPESNHLLYR
ncbi:MAG: hypothetical protein AYP45_02795 [Candidatus Brocadia carolinensis]|uniref:Uncharacterized protein n=1 Tax=Candidatus Brocadia carolinensis TaxID=1004156 RepID=A0A1V4AWS5_9BACT|nr:MAG: hypothetical protein AYP45_02795 [Candidatus Brocadia caroliniensis]